MCLIVAKNGVRKDKIKYIYKVFELRRKRLWGFYNIDYNYKAGYNYPKGKIDNEFSGVIGRGVLHAYTSINKLDKFPIVVVDGSLVTSRSSVAIRIPVRMEDILYCGKNKDVGLKKLFIPKGLYERVVGCCSPNLVRNYIPVYF